MGIYPNITPGGEGHWRSSGETIRNMTCEECRRRMCTDYLLNTLRCAECRQIKLERFHRLIVKAALVAVSGIFGWLLARNSR